MGQGGSYESFLSERAVVRIFLHSFGKQIKRGVRPKDAWGPEAYSNLT